MNEIYSLLFIDSFFANIAINSQTEVVLPSMVIFGGYNFFAAVLIALAAFFLATICNYYLGIVCFRLIIKYADSTAQAKKRIVLMRKHKWFNGLLCLCFVPHLGNFIILFSGFCKSRLSKVLTIVITVKFVYYIYMIYMPYNIISLLG